MITIESKGNTNLLNKNGNLVAVYSGEELPLFTTWNEIEGVSYGSSNISDSRTDFPSSYPGITFYAEVLNGLGILLQVMDDQYPEQYSYQQPEGEPGYYLAYLFSIETGHINGLFFEYKKNEEKGLSYGTFSGKGKILGEKSAHYSEYINFNLFGAPDDWTTGSYLDAKNYFRDILDPSNISANLIDDKTNILITNTVGKEYTLDGIKDYDGNLHGNTGIITDATKTSYKYQGLIDVNADETKEAIYTNKESGRWVTASLNYLGQINFSDHGKGGTTRIVGIYIDPLVTSGEVEQFGPHDSQRRFQNDLLIDNLTVKTSGDYDNDGFQEVYWKTNDGTAYLRALMHDDGNIQYANYQSEEQMSNYLNSKGFESEISSII